MMVQSVLQYLKSFNEKKNVITKLNIVKQIKGYKIIAVFLCVLCHTTTTAISIVFLTIEVNHHWPFFRFFWSDSLDFIFNRNVA